MPPKGKGKGKAPASTTTHTAARRSKLAKDNNISAEEEAEIKAAWALFPVDLDDDEIEDGQKREKEKDGVIATGNVQKALVAQGLGAKSKEDLDELIDVLDPEGQGYVTYPHFVELCAVLKSKNKEGEEDEDDESQVQEAFALFTAGTGTTATGGGTITLQHLRNVARTLKEDVSDDVLKAMILEANGGQGVSKGVDLQHFKQVMIRAGVFHLS